MSRASRLIRRLDKFSSYDSFGEDPSSFVDSVLASLEDERASLAGKPSRNIGLRSMSSAIGHGSSRRCSTV